MYAFSAAIPSLITAQYRRIMRCVHVLVETYVLCLYVVYGFSKTFSRTRGEALLEHGVFHAHLVVAGHVHGVHVHLAAGERVEGDVHADVQLVAWSRSEGKRRGRFGSENRSFSRHQTRPEAVCRRRRPQTRPLSDVLSDATQSGL